MGGRNENVDYGEEEVSKIRKRHVWCDGRSHAMCTEM